MFTSLSQCNGQALIHERQEMNRYIKNMLPTVELKSRRVFRYYKVDDNLIRKGHIIIANTFAGSRVIETFKALVQSGIYDEWEKISKWITLGLKSFNPSPNDQVTDIFEGKDMQLILMYIGSLLALGVVAFICEIAPNVIKGVISSQSMLKICKIHNWNNGITMFHTN